MLHQGSEFISRWKMFKHGENIDIEEEHVTLRHRVYIEVKKMF